MSRVIGDLEATVRSLRDTWQRQEQEATEGRRRLHEKMDAVRLQQDSLAAKVEQQTKELAEVRPAIKRFEVERQRREGATSMAKVLWSAIVAFGMGLGYVGHELLIYIWPPKH